MNIDRLQTKSLKRPLSCVIERDDNEYLAKAVDVPSSFGLGESMTDSLDSLKTNIESLREELNSDDKFTDDWKPIKNFLNEIVVETNDKFDAYLDSASDGCFAKIWDNPEEDDAWENL